MDTTEKVSVNMNIATISQIDLLIDKGYYSNRSDCINQAVRQLLDEKSAIIEEAGRRQKELDFQWFIGLMSLGRDDLLHAKEQGQKLRIKGYGLLGIDSGLDDLVLENVESITVRGKVLCSPQIKERFQL
ncbi:MAG: hypothetical protein HDT27_06450 [Subdoligranulum sp.]|nr:hypothetical protein [Subdoligranulum sp.]